MSRRRRMPLPSVSVRMTMLPNWDASVRRPGVVMVYSNAWSEAMGAVPTEPADTCMFCDCTAAMTSWGVMLRTRIFSGSSHTRML